MQISVIIPTCHRNDLLAKCLDCLAPGVQTLPADQYEVVVSDDGSKCTAEQMIHDHYPWVHWVAGPRKGPASNRNHGSKYAQADWLAFTDDDCLPSPQWLNAYVGAIVPDVHVYEGKTTCEAGIHTPFEESPMNTIGGCLWACNFMIRSSVFHSINGFDETFVVPGGEDVDFRQRLVESNYIFPFIDVAVVDHPPRRSRWGKRSGALWESQVLLWHRAGGKKMLPAKLLILVAKIRVKNLIRFSLQWDTLLSLLSTVIELCYIVQNVRTWQIKHCSQRQRARR